jgi:hypothetical protein
MIKKSILCLSAVFAMANAKAQNCATDEVNSDYRRLYPVIQQYQEQLEKEYQAHMVTQRVINASTKTLYPYTPTKDSNYNTVYIPVVVHIVHDFGTEYVSDNAVYEWIKRMNITYRKENADLANVIAPFKPYIGKANIQFVLANKDPYGNPTIGITRRQHYLTTGGDDQAKFDLWAPNRYLNIWLIRRIGRGASAGVVAAYSTFPASAAGFSFYDGIIGGAGFINASEKTYEHEIGHYLNLFHPWNNSNQAVSQACGDDEVDDTPPTTGHFGSGRTGYPQSGGNCNNNAVLYDSTCANGYVKIYPRGAGVEPDTANYPDTTNVQNIMDYADCPLMFTHMQVDRMRSALKSTVGDRNNLILPSNLEITGVMTSAGTLAPKVDMKPVAEYSVEKVTGISPERSYFLCADNNLTFNFKNQSWRDSITSVNWTFSNGATPSTSTAATGTVSVKISQPGWVTTKLTATSNAGDSTLERTDVYAADPNYKIDPNGYFQEFSNTSENEKWPIFNYYQNIFKWEIANVGYYDNTSIVYKAFDNRAGYNALTGAASSYADPAKLAGDVDDFFSPAFDLSGMKNGNCNLNFMFSGMWRTNDYLLMQDSFEIAYSIDCGNTWSKMATLTKADLARGNQSISYAPLSMQDWDLKSLNIPTAARENRVYFRFRYKPFANFVFGDQSVGNNYYIDRINVSSFPQGVNTLVGGNNNIAVAPNPTTKEAYVVVRGSMGAQSVVTVTDITGKVVYRTEQVLESNVSRVEIPANAIEAKGIYIVNIVAGAQTKTEKLVVR